MSLLVVSAKFDPTLSSVTPPVGGTSGGDLVELVGAEFADESDDADTRVFFGTVEADPTTVVLLNETRIRVVTPAGTGAVDVRLILPSGVEKTLVAVFTYQAGIEFLAADDAGTYLVTEGGDYLVV